VTGLVMPVPEPPAEDVAELNEQLLVAQHELAEATLRLAWVRDLNERARVLGTGERMRARVMTRVREVAVAAWSEELEALQERARKLGLQP
jgi:hypothetical protein